MNGSTRGWLVRAVVLPAAFVGMAGCYVYAPLHGGTPGVGSDVRATLNAEEAIRLSDRTGRLTRTYDGRLVGAGEDSLFLSVTTMRISSEFTGTRAFRQTIAIPRDGLQELMARELSPWRTGLTGALGVGAIYLAVNRVVSAGGQDAENGDDGQPVGTLVPIFRIPVGR